MHWVLALALVCSMAGCRRSAPPVEPSEPEPVAASPAAPADATAPAVRPTDANPGVATAATSAPPSTTSETVPVADVPPPSSPPAAAPDDHDNRIYSWVDEDGSIHYGAADEVPPTRRKGARVVDTGVTVVSPEPVGDVPSTAATTPAPPPAGDGGQTGEPRRRGAQPELDAAGLPIPGTMEDTAATRASKAAGETQIDPAAVERRRQEELRRMNCKEKDGVWICG